MNIYITKKNEERLRNLNSDKTMSGLINDLLDKYWAGQGPDIFPPEDINKKAIPEPTRVFPPPELQHEPMPRAPHRYYDTSSDTYVKWTPEEGITQP